MKVETALSILIFLVAIFLLPLIVFLCVKWGTFGFYRGKELNKKENGKEEEK